MTAAARLRAMAEKATGRPWRLGQCESYLALSGDPVRYIYRPGDDEPKDEGGTRIQVRDAAGSCDDDAALIVHLRNRAHLYADLIEAAAALRDRIERTTNPSYMHQDERVLIAALSAIDAADKEPT